MAALLGAHVIDRRVFQLLSAGAALALVSLVLGIVAGCDREPTPAGPRFGTAPSPRETTTYQFAVHPLHNPVKLTRAYQPLLDYLNANLQGARIELVASRDYADFEEKYRTRKPAFLLPNPWQTLQAEKTGYHVIATAGDPHDFAGIFVVRKESALNRPADLKGKAVSYPSATALAACIMPQYFLHTHGVDVTKDIENRYVGSQESSIMNAYLRLTAAGATWWTPWRAFQKDHPQEAGELKVLWVTEPLINNSIMARDDVPAAIVNQVRALLLALDKTPEGKRILEGMETSRFLPADDRDYEQVRSYVARFEQAVRPVDAP